MEVCALDISGVPQAIVLWMHIVTMQFAGF
jgi:hypothetical protein